MKKDYGKIAERLIELLGGKDNIKSVFHCMTRLRFYVKNKSLVNEKEIEKIPEVPGVNWYENQFQVIVGNEVDAIFKALESKGIKTGEEKENSKSSNGVFSKIVDTITGCMTPMIPALTAAGMIKVILTLTNYFHILTDKSSTYQVLNFIGDVAFYFMPFLIAANAAKVFKVNQALSLIIAGVLLHPNFVKLVEGKGLITFIGLPVSKVSYSYSVIPIILMVWIMSYIEKLVDRITPKMTKIILNPTLVILICAPLALILVGPAGDIAGNGLAVAINFLSQKLGFVVLALLAAAFPFIVMTGMHHALTPIGLSAIATGGSDTLIFVSQICANIAQSGATFAVAVKTKNKNMKQLSAASGISALMGITEPALYGVTMKLKRPIFAAAIAAGIGGVVGGILQVSLYIPQNSIMSIPCFIGKKGMGNLVYGIIMIAVTFVSSFIITYVIGFEDIKEQEAEELEESKLEAQKEVKPLVEKIEVFAPIKGEVVALENVPDKVFADKSLGAGIAVIPDEGKVYSPVDGKVTMIMDSKHGIAIEAEEGLQLLIHIGLETVKLNGKYFKAHVQNGDLVKKGDLLIEFDKEKIEAEGYNLITPILVVNANDYIKSVPMVKEREKVQVNDKLLTIV
ncbi:beta-glucoside-specific PTS transporter subunit IIABC [Clostridium neuense]|uniref:Beta-glucoside-specific PTS transporter subunit IIABC n=1 Tax=Clostridium neuense TaxID=1728934 RepID=A0ABW8TJ53_9CLOT